LSSDVHLVLYQWFLNFLALLPLELANKDVITAPVLNDRYEEKKENHERLTNTYFILIICTTYFDAFANKK
jgi:hypothetical protein